MAQQIDIVANLLMKVDGAEAGINKLKNSLSKLEVPKGLENSFNKSFSNLDSIFERYRKQLSKGFDTKADVSNMSKIGKELDVELTKVSNHIQKLTGEKIDFKVDSEPVKRATRDLEEILEKRRQLAQEKLEVKVETPKDNINNIKQLLEEFQRVLGSTNAGKAASNALFHLDTGDIEKAIPYLKEAESNLTRIGEKKREAFSGTGFTLEGALTKIIGELTKTDSEFSTVNDKAKLFQRALTEAQTGQLKDVGSLLDRMSQGFDKTASSAREAAKAGNDYAQSMFSMQQQVSQLQQSTQYFFSLRNMINLLKRGVREAVQTVKELDAAMTETAVVTKFDVGDMWAKLPEYTANANALGATVQDMYESTTLYYQQGLNAQQAMSIASETMKMARIGGLEAAEATDMMTAALRGFNMELNETSAQRINDVYSNLAAKTASNTEELGTAMQRTASIAASAGMSFEGTTAFLAQAIETTREPAENLGTAMKTIIARFQELKKNPLEMTEVDGETVDYNKVDAALKTIGVDLKDTNGQFRNLDQVFLDISKRWDGLTQTQQRYIATTAAGSRQQSRFIAMMSNYDRTMQLMDYANNADGASNEQFGKTLESLEAKLNKFKNAWKEFLMGIMNDSWTKKIVDGMTGVLNTVNSIINALSLGSKGIKSALSLFTAFTALRVAGRGANALIGGLGGMVDPQSTARAGMRTGAIGRNSAQAINQPIVRELQSIRALIAQKINSSNLGRNQVTGPYDEYNRFREARAAVAQMGGKGTIGDLKKQLSGLSASNQNLLISGNAGTFTAATDAIIDKYKPENRKAVRLGERFLNNQRKSAQITAEEYYTALQDPGLLKRAMTKAGVQKDNPAYQYIDSIDKAVTQRAKDYENEAIKKFDKAVEGKNIDEEALERARKALSSDQTKENYRRRALEEQGGASSQQISFSTSKLGKALDGVGKIGTGISQAGMGIQAFGSILTGSANPAVAMFGSLLTSTGGLISGIGMGISGLTMGFTSLAKSVLIENVASRIVTAAKHSEAIASLGVTGVASALTGILFGLVAVIGLAIAAHKKLVEHIKKEAEEVTQNYQDKSQENQTNLANLKQWKSELAVLSKGVDENGLNVSLDASDYQHYLEIVDGIAKINPSIVKGYNAQGHAIIDNNNALEKTLELEERRAKQIVSDYTNDDSLRKLLRARNLERQYRAGGGNGDKYIETIDFELKPRTDMRHQISQIGSELRRNKDKIDLSALGIDIDALASGSEAEFKKVANNIDLFRQVVTDSIDRAGDEWSDASRESIEKAFDAYGDSSAELDELTQPLYDALSVKASQTAGFQNMAENLKAPFQNALKDLATTGNFTNGKDIGDAAKNMALKFAGYNDIYLDAMQKVESANKQFALDFSEANYDANTEDAITELENLKTTLEDTPEGHAISEWIDNEINKIENHLTDGVASVEQAWNTMSDKIAVAESAAEDFKKATEKDYSTAADGMKEIYDTAMGEDTYHSIGYGDNTFWTAAEKLLGKNNIMDLETDQVRGMMKEVEPFLKEGPEGVQNFASKVAGLSDSLDKIKGIEMTSDGWFESIDDNVNPEVWKELSDALGISEELLTSMLNKARQFRKMSFSDMNAVREAYAADDTVIRGVQKTQITTTDENGVEQTVSANKLYITDAELQNQMGSDYYNAEERGKKKEELNAKGIEVLPEHLKNLDASMMKNELGIQNMTDAIETFGKTGAFDKTEIQDAARIIAKEQLGDKFDEETFNKEFNDGWAGYLENMEYPTLEPLQSIESLVATIADSVTTKQIENGILAKRKSGEIDEAINGEANVDDTLADFFRQGKDVHGNDLNAYTYQAGLNQLQDLRTSTQSYLDSLKKGRNRASTKEERDRFDEEIANTKQSLQALNDAIEAGTKEFEESQKPDEQNPNDSTGTSTKPSPYTEEEEAYYSRNAIGEWFNNLFKGGSSDYEYSTGSRESYSAKDGAGNSQNTSESSSAMTEAASGLNTAGTTLTESGTTLSEGTTNLTESATNLTEAGTNLSTASENLGTAAQNLTSAAAIIVANGQGGNNGGKTTSQTPSAESSISGIVVIDNSAALESLDDLKAKAEETKGVIESKATFTVDVSGADKLDKASRAASNLVSKNGSSASIAVSTGAVDKKSVTQGISEINRSKATILIDANTQSALQKARNLANTIDSYHATIDISPNFTGTWTKTVYVKEVPEHAKGQNNYGIVAPPPTLGSAARGRYGQLGPKGKGGLTLTGELGYEIAWLPSENRSMILGADGPQMVNLPGDAVVWTHEQSKKMMAQKSIPAGSHVLKSSSGWNFGDNPGNSTGGGKTTGGNGGNDKTTQKEEKVVQKAEDVVKNAGTVIVWWENSTRQMEAIQKRVDANQKRFEKLSKAFGTTPKSIQSVVADYRKNLKQQIALSNAQITQAKKELNQFAGSHTNNWRTRKEISYEEKYKEDGETKSRSQKVTVDLSNFIFFNKKTGAYEISQAAINGQAKKNQSKAEAIAQAAEKEINERNNKLKTAEDNLQKAQEALEKLANDVYETFYNWKKSINQIYLLSKKLEVLTQQISIQDKAKEIELTKIGIGLADAYQPKWMSEMQSLGMKEVSTLNNALDNINLNIDKTQSSGAHTSNLNTQNTNPSDAAANKIIKLLKSRDDLLMQEVKARNQAIVDARQEYLKVTNIRTYKDIYDKNKESPEALKDYQAAQKALQILNEAHMDSLDTFNYQEALKRIPAEVNKETYDKIKEVFDNILDVQNNVSDSITSAQDSVLKIYQQIQEYQEIMSNFEQELLSGIEQQAEEQADKLERINSTLSKAYKELIDEVKQALDERRKQEDNQKTESELSQKQQRLSMLRADTSGGHAVEIAQLEKEIADAQQNYQRSLEDQLIEKLQQQGDKAEQQRQKQIDLLNIQKDIAKETGTNIAQVREWMSDPKKYKDAIIEAWMANHAEERGQYTEADFRNKAEQAYVEFTTARDRYSAIMSEDLKNLKDSFADILNYDHWIQDKLEYGVLKVEYSRAQKRLIGYTATEQAREGATYKDLQNAGYTKKGSVQALANVNGLDWVIDNLNASAKALTTDYGYSLAQVQKAYNKSKTSKTNKNYMAGAVAKLTKGGKNVASATLPASGSLIRARSGSTLYAQELDRTTGEWKKDAAQYSIGAINAQQIKGFNELGKQALLNAIQTTSFGGFINKDFKSLVKATGLAGKEVKLANGWTGSIGSDGLIYQNHATGVKKWNPATKTVTEDKYNDSKKQAFLNVAKRNSETSREYAQVLMNNKAYTKAQLQAMGVKKFRTGGLADYTGPAWLDGTPTKPELVLNATDTKNFIALKDVLSKAIGSTHAISNEYGGDTTFEININVDHIANDYDVDKMAERVKKIIVKDSSYRNVTQVRKFR